jgi:hypothetical protein
LISVYFRVTLYIRNSIYYLLRYAAVQSDESSPTFRTTSNSRSKRKTNCQVERVGYLAYFSAMKMEAIRSSETSANSYYKAPNHRRCHRQNLKFALNCTNNCRSISNIENIAMELQCDKSSPLCTILYHKPEGRGFETRSGD